MSFAIVFSELTCKNGTAEGVTIFFSELNDNCSVTFNVLLSGCQGQSKKNKTKKTKQKIEKWLLLLSIQP